MTIRIILVDDHEIVRAGLRMLLQAQTDIEIVGEAENGQQAMQLCHEKKPDVVIMDITMPLLNGIEATRLIKKAYPRTKVIILSMHSHNRFISELLTLGASGYLLKDSCGSDIITAIHAARSGDTYLSPSISRRLVEDYVSLKRTTSSREELYGKLSNREREVFQMIAEGRSTKEIADILCVSMSTIKTHRSNIMEKLQMENLSQLVHFAIELGLVEIQS